MRGGKTLLKLQVETTMAAMIAIAVTITMLIINEYDDARKGNLV